MKWADLKYLANENHTLCDRRFFSPTNSDTLIFFLHFSRWFLENESILVGIFVANPCACSLNSPFVDPSHMKSWISQKSHSKTNFLSGCWHFLKDVQSVVLLNYRRRLQPFVILKRLGIPILVAIWYSWVFEVAGRKIRQCWSNRCLFLGWFRYNDTWHVPFGSFLLGLYVFVCSIVYDMNRYTVSCSIEHLGGSRWDW